MHSFDTLATVEAMSQHPVKPLSQLVEPGWAAALQDVEPQVHHMGDFLRSELQAGRQYLPASHNILRAFTIPFDSIKVLIVGQDPYPTPGHPVGLSFCVAPDVRPLPKSLVNIYRELVDDMHVPMPANGDLTPWTQRGVMLLNRCLTVGVGRPNSHQGKGWETITEAAIRALDVRVDADGKPKPLVAILWGRRASRRCSPTRPSSPRRIPALCPHPAGSSAPTRSPAPTKRWSPWARNRSTGHCHRRRRIGPIPTPRLLRHGKVGSMALFTSKPSMPSQLANAIPMTGAMPAAPMRTPVPAPSAALTQDDLRRARQLTDRIRARFAQTLVGQSDLREALIATMVAGGHILIESVPGLAKTTAAQTLATSVSGTFRRVQCTPDLMPSDLVGTQVFDFSTQRFSTQIGPIHANFVLLDEINRSNAKTQSAMLEAMAEGATTIGGERIELPKPFMVIATENPIEEEGTFNLPEAQMDRFMMKAVMTYPKADEETSMLAMLTRRGTDMFDPKSLPSDTITIQDVKFLRKSARRVHVSEAIMRYAVDLVATSRGAGNKPLKGLSSTVRLGASPRASIALIRSGQANALLAGRDYVIPEDVKMMVHEVLRHRVILTFEALADGVTSDQVIDRIVETVHVP